jgi:hypothetical protein
LLRTLVRPHPTSSKAIGLLALTGLAAFSLTACGSSNGGSASSQSTTQQDCTAIANVLSDGPDPGADPVGYAEAQVLPLEQLKVAEPSLRQAVDALDSAYRKFSANDGADSARYAVKVSVAEKALNKICPNAAP